MEVTWILCLEVEVLDSFVHLELFFLFLPILCLFTLLWSEGCGMERSEVECVNSVCLEPCMLCMSECNGRLVSASTACPQTWNVEQCRSGRMGVVQIWLQRILSGRNWHCLHLLGGGDGGLLRN